MNLALGNTNPAPVSAAVNQAAVQRPASTSKKTKPNDPRSDLSEYFGESEKELEEQWKKMADGLIADSQAEAFAPV